MSNTMPALRAALVAALRAGVTEPAGLEVYPKIKASPSLPCLWVAGVDEVEYHVTSRLGDTGTRWRFLISGITQAELLDDVSQDMCDHWLSDGAGGVRAALEGDSYDDDGERIPGGAATLGGIVEDVIVRESSGHKFFIIPNLGTRFGADWLVDVYA